MFKYGRHLHTYPNREPVKASTLKIERNSNVLFTRVTIASLVAFESGPSRPTFKFMAHICASHSFISSVFCNLACVEVWCGGLIGRFPDFNWLNWLFDRWWSGFRNRNLISKITWALHRPTNVLFEAKTSMDERFVRFHASTLPVFHRIVRVVVVLWLTGARLHQVCTLNVRIMARVKQNNLRIPLNWAFFSGLFVIRNSLSLRPNQFKLLFGCSDPIVIHTPILLFVNSRF